jgi:hypothetical protein
MLYRAPIRNHHYRRPLKLPQSQQCQQYAK